MIMDKGNKKNKGVVHQIRNKPTDKIKTSKKGVKTLKKALDNFAEYIKNIQKVS